MENTLVAYLVVSLFGVIVGTAEVVSRYRDKPTKAIFSPPGILYILVNIGASCLALYFILIFEWTFGADENTSKEAIRLTQVMVAGFSSLALFRSALLTVRVGDNDLNVGPSAFLQTLLNATDRAVDRNRANERAEDVAKIMQNMQFDVVLSALPSICFGLMQNLPQESKDAATNELESLVRSSLTEEVKLKLLGLTLMNAVGPEVLENAVKVYKNETQ